jgi:hypothetical protein
MIQALFLLLFVLHPDFLGGAPAFAASPASPEVIEEVERAFQDAMSAWSYNRLWSLWDMGKSRDRQEIPQGEFESRMNRARMKPALGPAVDSIRVQVQESSAWLTARVTLEDQMTVIVGSRGRISVGPGQGRTEVSTRTFSLTHEDGRWRIGLRDFLNMAGAP